MKKAIIIAAVVIVVLGVWAMIANRPSSPTITSFEECAAVYPVMESYPEQCRTPSGQLFVRDISGDLHNLIKLESPLSGDTVTSPLKITGQARGTWYFEASFPVKLVDDNGIVLAEAPAQAQGEWMTEEFVPFAVTLNFKTPTTQAGTLMLRNDNPSGDPARDKELRIPVVFGSNSPAKNVVFGKAIALSIQDKVIFPDGLQVALTAINDSRCKPDVQCIWAGELSPVLQISGGALARTDTVQLGTITTKQAVKNGYTFLLQSAEPGRATIVVSKTTAGSSPAGISGYIHIGPTCPVQKDPPDPNCADKAFADAVVIVRSASTGAVVKQLATDEQGAFIVSLAPGNYTVSAGPRSGLQLPRCDLVNATVTANAFVSVDISCDSGIR